MTTDDGHQAHVNLREGRTGPPTGPPAPFNIEPEWGRLAIAADPEDAARRAHRLGTEARHLLAFIPEHVNPAVLERGRLEALMDAAGDFLELAAPTQGRLATDVTDGERRQLRMTSRLRELVPALQPEQAAAVVDELLAAA